MYPSATADRDRWILDRRPARNRVDASRAYASLIEEEPSTTGEIVSVATIFLTNRECPWRCVMCDLWKNTLTESVPPGAIPRQIHDALDQLMAHRPAPRQVKLYNSGSFFDPRAIPPADHPAIAALVRSFERIIVECHPALVGEPVARFRDQLSGQLEVAMGLETAHPEVLARLNKRMTLDQFAAAAAWLRREQIALRTFILVQPPFLAQAEAQVWGERSLDFALDCGATATTLIPTRLGNGALEALAQAGEFAPPSLATVEAVLGYGLGQKRGRVFADLWDLEQFSGCTTCFAGRQARLRRMNLSQQIQPPIACPVCEVEA